MKRDCRGLRPDTRNGTERSQRERNAKRNEKKRRGRTIENKPDKKETDGTKSGAGGGRTDGGGKKEIGEK